MAVISGSGGGATYKNTRILKKRSPGGSIPKPKPTSITKAGGGKMQKQTKPSKDNSPYAWYYNEFQNYNSAESQAEAAQQVQEVKEKKTNPYSWYRNEYQQYNSPASQAQAQAQVDAQKQADATFFARAGNAAQRIFGGGGMPLNYPMKRDNPFTGDGYTTVEVPGRGTDDRQPVPIVSGEVIDYNFPDVLPSTLAQGIYPTWGSGGGGGSGGGSSWYTGGRRPSSGGGGSSGFSSQYPSWWQALMGLGNWNIR